MRSPVSLCLLAALSLFSGNLFAGTAALHSSGSATQPDSTALPSAEDGNLPVSQFTIPGPLRSFMRMAGISQKVTPEEVLPLLSRNVFAQGYEESRPTEFLVLLRRYIVQARELTTLAAANGMVIRVSNCDDARPLLRILGYRPRPNCGQPGSSLQTEDPERAFLTIDSGFPLPELEQTLEGGKAFEYPFASSSIPVLFAEGEWTQASRTNNKESSNDLVDTIVNDPAVARLYWAFSKLDPDTSIFFQRSIGIAKLLPYGAVLDFYGRRICIRDGRVVVPGGVAAEPAWKDLVGASPASPAAFVTKLLAKDKGWLAAYFDVLSRTSGAREAYFTDAHRLRFFYAGLRAPSLSVEATKGVFRPAPAMLLLTTRLQFDNNGEPLVPGNLAVWNEILSSGQNNRLVRKAGKQNGKLSSADQLVQLMFTLSRANTDSGPLQSYMAISQLDSKRSSGHHLTPETVRLLAGKFEDFSDQYRIFSEFPELSDESITLFLHTAQALDGVPGPVRGNAFGTFQAEIGLWQILARQGQIAPAHLNESWQQIIQPFAAIRSGAQLYEAGQTSFGHLMRSATGKSNGSQDEIIELLAGPRQSSPEGMRMHREIAGRIRSVLDDQRLVSLDTLFTVGNALRQKERGKEPEEYVVLLAGETREFQMPRPIFTNGERVEWAAGVYNNHHAETQMRTDLTKVLKMKTASTAQIEEALGQLSSFLRDTLVGLNYAYYEPPGAQALHNNPLLVRSHDFAGETVSGIKTLWQAPTLLGQGSPAGGGAHFVGSIADLPYSLAEIEQDFIAPDNVQALVWQELAPELLITAVLPRWWNVSPLELHAIALYQRTGEELLTESIQDDALRNKVMGILSDRLPPRQLEQVQRDLRTDRLRELLPQMMPADTFYLATEFLRKYPEQPAPLGTAMQELKKLSEQHPEQVNWDRLSHDFGTPHPNLARTYGLELLNVPPMPAFSGDSSRYMAESWDSPNLYWARIADEAGYSPVMLNHLVPELTRLMVKKIFATDLEDWPALLRAMHEAGDDFRQGKLDLPQRVSSGSTLISSHN